MERNSILSRIEENVAKVMIGKKEVTRLLLAALAAGGHVLLEDVLNGQDCARACAGKVHGVQV